VGSLLLLMMGDCAMGDCVFVDVVVVVYLRVRLLKCVVSMQVCGVLLAYQEKIAAGKVGW
jgi:hypothetical protein